MSEPVGDMEAVTTAARESVPPTELEPGRVYAIRHAAGGLDVTDLDAMARYPRVQAFSPDAEDPLSFAAIFQKFATDASTIWASYKSRWIVAILDEYVPGKTAWRRQRLSYEPRYDPNYLAWREVDGSNLTQVDFAEFIEENAHYVVNVPAADMIELAQTFSAKRSATFRSTNILRDGSTTLHYVDETVEAKAGSAGDVTIPSEFMARMPIFEGGEEQTIVVRFRWRIVDGHLRVILKLARRNEIENTAFDGIVETIQQALGKNAAKIWKGKP